MDSWPSNLSEIYRTVSFVPKYQSSIIRSFSRVVCNLPSVCRLLCNVRKFDKCNKIHSNVALDTLKCLNCSGNYPGITCSTCSLILLLSSLTLQKEAQNPIINCRKQNMG